MLDSLIHDLINDQVILIICKYTIYCGHPQGFCTEVRAVQGDEAIGDVIDSIHPVVFSQLSIGDLPGICSFQDFYKVVHCLSQLPFIKAVQTYPASLIKSFVIQGTIGFGHDLIKLINSHGAMLGWRRGIIRKAEVQKPQTIYGFLIEPGIRVFADDLI